MKILVISLAGIGDTLFATPLIHELRANFPNAELDALVMWPGARNILEGNPHLNVIHQQNLIRLGLTGTLRYLTKLRGRYDLTVNSSPQSRVHYRLVARFIAAPRRFTHAYGHLAFLDPFLVTNTIPQDYTIHCVENNLALLDSIGAQRTLPNHRYELFLSQQDHAWADRYLGLHQLKARHLLGIHVGSGGTKNLALRRWPLDSYCELIRRINRNHPSVAVLLFGGPEEEKDHERLLAQLDRKLVLSPETKNLRQAAALLGRCDSFLSVDTALMHVAAAVQVPSQVVIETPTWNKTVEPYGQPHVLVPNPRVAGRNLGYYRYDGSGIHASTREILQCMQAVTVDRVYEALIQTWEKATPGNPSSGEGRALRSSG